MFLPITAEISLRFRISIGLLILSNITPTPKLVLFIIFAVHKGLFITFAPGKYLDIMRNSNKTSDKHQGGIGGVEQNKAMFDLAGDAIFTVSPDGFILELSSIFESDTGWSISEWIGKPFINLIHPEEVAFVLKRFSDLNKGIVSRSAEIRILKKSGDYFYCDILALPNYSNGKITKILGVARDITLKKIAEEAIIKSEKRYRTLFNASPDGIILIGTDGRIQDANIAESRMFRYSSPDEMIGIHVSQLAAPQSRISASQILTRRLRGEIIPSFQYSFLRKDRTVFFGETSASILRDDNEKITGYICVTRDITDSRLKEEALLINNSRLELAMQSANMAWWGMEVNTGNVTFDDRKPGMLGFPPARFKHYKDFMALVHPADNERVMNAMRSHLDGTSDRYVSEYRMLTNSGKYLWFYDVGTIVKRDSQGSPLNLTGIVIDITERKKTEYELFKAKEKAEKSKKILLSLNQHLLDVKEKERATISREIHDLLGQSLTALKIDINWLQSRSLRKSETRSRIESMMDLVTSTIKDVQRISSYLRPSILDDLGLSSAMEWFCEDFSNRTGLQVNMEFENVQFEKMEYNLALYRVLQEALTNVIRHAGAKMASVKLFKSRNKINLIVSDDGMGIPSDKIRSSQSLGLMGMFERIKYAGGEMKISKPVAGGTKISVAIPLKV